MNTQVATATKPQPKAAPPKPEALDIKTMNQVKVIYHPGPDDRVSTIWNRITFHANKPMTLSRQNRTHFIDIDIPVEVTAADGFVGTRTRSTRLFMGEVALTNPNFEVVGFPRYIKKLALGRRPQTEEEYRSWAQAWIMEAGNVDEEGHSLTDINSPRELKERWDDEDAMRERLGVSDETILFLKPFFDMKAMTLKGNVVTARDRRDGGEDLMGGFDED